MKLRLKIKLLLVLIWMSLIMGCEPGGDTQGLKDTLTVNALNIQNIYLQFEYSDTLNSDVTYFAVNDTEQIFAKANDANGANINQSVTWSTSNSAIAQVDQNGLLTTTSSTGSVTVYATIGSVVSTLDVIVSDAVMTAIKYINRETQQEIDASNNTVTLCDSFPLDAIGTFADEPPSERVMTEKIEWAMGPDNPEGGKVTDTGIFSAYSTSVGDPIVPYVVVTSYEESPTPEPLNLVVEQLGFQDVSEVSPEMVKIPKNDPQQFQASALFNGELKSITDTAKWESSVNLVANDPVNGLATGKNKGITDISASCTAGDTIYEKQATLEVTDDVTVISLQIRSYSNNTQVPGTVLITENEDEDYTVYAMMSDDTSKNVSENAVWTIDHVEGLNVISIDDETYVGNDDSTEDRVRVTAQSPGSADLKATYDGESTFIPFIVQSSQ